MKTVTLSVEGMHCEGCVSRVEKALSKVEGVQRVDVSLEREEATVETGDQGSDAPLVRAVEEAGYEASVKA